MYIQCLNKTSVVENFKELNVRENKRKENEVNYTHVRIKTRVKRKS